MNDKSIDAFRTISEVAEDLDLPPHVLRFWETRFGPIRPMKRAGGRRYYRPDDVELLKGIRHLLYVKGFTIRGVQKILKESGHRFVIAIGRGDAMALSELQSGRAPEFVGDEPEIEMPDEEEAPQEEALDELDTLVGLPGGMESEASAPQRSADIALTPRVEPTSEARGKGLAGLIRREPSTVTGNGQGRGLPKESVEALDRVILQLLECKRLLDQVR